jgi:hypothetical protein
MSWSSTNIPPQEAPEQEFLEVIARLQSVAERPDERSAAAILRIWREQVQVRTGFSFLVTSTLLAGTAALFGAMAILGPVNHRSTGMLLLVGIGFPVLIGLLYREHRRSKYDAEEQAAIGRAAADALIKVSICTHLRHRGIDKQRLDWAKSHIRKFGDEFRGALISILDRSVDERQVSHPDV